MENRSLQVEGALYPGQRGVHAGRPAADDPNRPGGRSIEARTLLEPAALKPQHVVDLRSGEIEMTGDPRASHPQSGDRPRWGRVSSPRQSCHDGRPKRALGPPARPFGRIVSAWRAHAQVHLAAFGEGVPQLMFGRGQFFVRQH